MSHNFQFTDTFKTVISGVLVFIIGQLFIELLIKPLKRYKDIKAKIAYNLVYYANVYSNPVTHKDYENNKIREERDKTQEILRGLAAEIVSFSEEKWFFNYPSIKTIDIISSSLIGLSNSLISENSNIVDVNEDRVKNIRSSLHLKSKTL